MVVFSGEPPEQRELKEVSEDNEEDVIDKFQKTPFAKFIQKVVLAFGFLSRLIIIPALGYLAYQYVDPPDISDIPFAELTMRMVGDVFLAVVVIGAFGMWFLKFPDSNERGGFDGERLYVTWARAGALLIMVILFFILR